MNNKSKTQRRRELNTSHKLPLLKLKQKTMDSYQPEEDKEDIENITATHLGKFQDKEYMIYTWFLITKEERMLFNWITEYATPEWGSNEEKRKGLEELSRLTQIRYLNEVKRNPLLKTPT